MADGQRAAPPPDLQAPDLQAPERQASELQAPGLQAVARDWITIWQSELTAMASDRELQDAWVRVVANWSAAAELMARLLPNGRHDNAAGHARPASAAGSPPPMAPPDDRDAAIQRLADRIAELERRLDLNGLSDGSSNRSPGDTNA